jgi:hypothetical protein
VDLVGGSAEWISASNSAVNISGGELGWFAATDSSVTLSGGTQDAMHFQVWESQGESELHILGQEFYLDGLPIDGVANLGDSMLLDVERKHQALTGILMDGNVFRIELHSRAADGCTSYGCSDFIDHDVTIRLTNAVPEPAGRCLGLLALLLLTIVRVKAYA